MCPSTTIGGRDRCLIQWRHGVATDEETAETIGIDPDVEDREDVKDGSGAYERTELMHAANESKRLKYFQYLEDLAAGGTGNIGDGELPVQRWTGRLVAPSAIPATDLRMPESNLELDWVYGYRSHDCRSNVKYAADSRLVLFHVAKIAVCYNKEKHLQSFMKEHTDEIVSMAVHPTGRFCATGQVGKRPHLDLDHERRYGHESDQSSSGIAHHGRCCNGVHTARGRQILGHGWHGHGPHHWHL